MWDFVFLFFSACRNRKNTHGPFSAIEPLGGNDCECGGEEPDSRMNTT